MHARRWHRVALIAFLVICACSSEVTAQDGNASLGIKTAPFPFAPSTVQPAPVQVPPVQTYSITNGPNADPPAQRDAPSQQPPAKPAQGQGAQDGEQTDFQDFIYRTAGDRLPLYGYSLFQRAPSTFAPVDNVPVTPDYVIGPGDELVIRAWGQVDIDYRTPVDRNGMITLPRVGSVQVSGVPYKGLTEHIRTPISRYYRNFELMVTLGQLRSVQIFVVGQARSPGAYTVSSLSTLVNAIFAVGGPSTSGSMRAIHLKRGDRVVTEFDLYDLLLRGDKSKDAQLLPGDVIYFPPVGPLAAVAGRVKNPAIFELKGAGDVADLLRYAGGLTTTARTSQATIERIHNRQTRVVDQFTLDLGGMARTIKDGDLINVFTVSPKFDNAVTLRGNVAQPLRYPFQRGMRVSDLIPDRESLITRDYYDRKNLAVRLETVRQGELTVAVRHLADEINWNYAVIERQNDGDLSTALIPFNLGKAILEGDVAHNLPLLPGDVVTVFSKSDVPTPMDRRAAVVRLEGEFNYAGVYQAMPGETLRQLVTRVGGVSKNAYLYGAQFTRESTRTNQQQRLQQALDQLEQDIQRAGFTRASNVVSVEEAASLKQEADAQRTLLARLRTVKPTGRIVLEMPRDAEIADLPDMPLEDGDRLFLPQRPSMVSVFGTVYNESSFLWRPGKTVGDYLAQAGGARKEADRDSIYLIRADGTVVSRSQSGFLIGSLNSLQLMPGDTVVVPEDFTRTTVTKDAKDWTQILYQFGLGAAALKVIGQ